MNDKDPYSSWDIVASLAMVERNKTISELRAAVAEAQAQLAERDAELALSWKLETAARDLRYVTYGSPAHKQSEYEIGLALAALDEWRKAKR